MYASDKKVFSHFVLWSVSNAALIPTEMYIWFFSMRTRIFTLSIMCWTLIRLMKSWRIQQKSISISLFISRFSLSLICRRPASIARSLRAIQRSRNVTRVKLNGKHRCQSSVVRTLSPRGRTFFQKISYNSSVDSSTACESISSLVSTTF